MDSSATADLCASERRMTVRKGSVSKMFTAAAIYQMIDEKATLPGSKTPSLSTPSCRTRRMLPTSEETAIKSHP
jgi:hypothetical protein